MTRELDQNVTIQSRDQASAFFVSELNSSGVIEWKLLADYYETKLRGMRKQAFHYLDEFVNNLKDGSFLARKRFISWLCDKLQSIPPSLQWSLLPQPISEQLFWPTLYEWIKLEPDNPIPLRWLGIYLNGDTDSEYYLRQAIRLDLKEQLARITLARRLSRKIWLHTERVLFQNHYSGNPSEDLVLIVEIKEIINKIQDQKIRNEYRNNLESLQKVIESWLAFTISGEANFSQWCAAHGYSFDHLYITSG